MKPWTDGSDRTWLPIVIVGGLSLLIIYALINAFLEGSIPHLTSKPGTEMQFRECVEMPLAEPPWGGDR